MDDKTPGLPFYQMVPKEDFQYAGLLSLLLYFRWTWIGVGVMDNENGERFVQTVLPEFSLKGICFDFMVRLPQIPIVTEIMDLLKTGAKIRDKVIKSTANVVVAYGESYSMMFFRFIPYLSELEHETNPAQGKVWIITAQVEITSMAFQRTWDIELYHGALAFTIHSNDLPAFQQFVEKRHPYRTKGDGFLRDFWQHAFDCVFPNSVNGKVESEICTGEEKLQNLPESLFEMSVTGHSYCVYNAIYAVAHALHAMSSSRINHKASSHGGELVLQQQHLWQVVDLISL